MKHEFPPSEVMAAQAKAKQVEHNEEYGPKEAYFYRQVLDIFKRRVGAILTEKKALNTDLVGKHLTAEEIQEIFYDIRNAQLKMIVQPKDPELYKELTSYGRKLMGISSKKLTSLTAADFDKSIAEALASLRK